MYSYIILNLSTRWRYMVIFTPRPYYPWEKPPVYIEYQAVCVPDLVWVLLERRKYLFSAIIRIPDGPIGS
jgi:hypothetical protein